MSTALPAGGAVKSHSHLRVLLVDDHSVFLDSAEVFLARDPGLKMVGRAGSGVEAIRMARELTPDLILMDIAMPAMGGLEATRRIKQGSAAPRIILLTLHDTAEYQTSAREAGADGLVPKRDFVDALPGLIAQLFGSDRSCSLNANAAPAASNPSLPV